MSILTVGSGTGAYFDNTSQGTLSLPPTSYINPMQMASSSYSAGFTLLSSTKIVHVKSSLPGVPIKYTSTTTIEGAFSNAGSWSDPSSYTQITGTVSKVTTTYQSLSSVFSVPDPPPASNVFETHPVDVVPILVGQASPMDWLQGKERAVGGDGNDIFYVYADADSIYGGGGNDFVHCGSGADEAYGGTGSDTLWGGQGIDALYGEDGDDAMNGNLGDDVVFGGEGSDTVWGGNGNDTVWGGNGNDRVAGNLGDDTLWGGDGADLFEFRAGFGADVIGDFSYSAGDRIELATGATYTLGAASDGSATVDLGNGDTLRLIGIAQSAITADWFTRAA